MKMRTAERQPLNPKNPALWRKDPVKLGCGGILQFMHLGFDFWVVVPAVSLHHRLNGTMGWHN